MRDLSTSVTQTLLFCIFKLRSICTHNAHAVFCLHTLLYAHTGDKHLLLNNICLAVSLMYQASSQHASTRLHVHNANQNRTMWFAHLLVNRKRTNSKERKICMITRKSLLYALIDHGKWIYCLQLRKNALFSVHICNLPVNSSSSKPLNLMNQRISHRMSWSHGNNFTLLCDNIKWITEASCNNFTTSQNVAVCT